MFSRPSKSPFTPSPQRAVALLVAISVLAILTMLVMALVFSTETAQQMQRTANNQMRAEEIARSALGLTLTVLAKLPEPLAAPKEYTAQLADSLCRIAAAPADGASPLYANQFIQYRPGDTLIEIRVQDEKPGQSPERSFYYLVNAAPQHPRRIALWPSAAKSIAQITKDPALN